MPRSLAALCATLTCTFLLTACQPSGADAPSTESATAQDATAHTATDAIDAVYRQFSEAYDRLDVDQVAMLYAEDARYLQPGSDLLTGRAAIREAFASFFTRSRTNDVDLDIDFALVDRDVAGDLAYDVGYYRITSTLPDGSARQGAGKFVTVLRRQDDGTWRFVVDGFSDAPVDAFPADSAAHHIGTP